MPINRRSSRYTGKSNNGDRTDTANRDNPVEEILQGSRFNIAVSRDVTVVGTRMLAALEIRACTRRGVRVTLDIQTDDI